MGSESPPREPPEKLDVVHDPDFGEMQLVRQWFHAQDPGDSHWTRLSLIYWEGALSGVPFQIYVDEVGAFPAPPREARDLMVRLAASADKIALDVAAELIDTARDWAAGVDLSVPTVQSLARGLRLDVIHTYEDWAPTLYFEETEPDMDRTIFAGHVVEVRFAADGVLQSAGIAG